MLSDPGPEGFGNRFFGGKPRRQERGWAFVRETIGQFIWTENPLEKPISIFLVQAADARNLDHVNAGAENHSLG